MVSMGKSLHGHWGKACFALKPLKTLEEFKLGDTPTLDPELQKELDRDNDDNDEDMVTVWASFNWLYRQWSPHTTPIAIGEDTAADMDCGFMKMANRFLQHEAASRPRLFDKRHRSEGGKVTATHYWKGDGVPVKSGHILRFKVKKDEEEKFLQMLWVQWYLLLIAALGGVGNYQDTAGDTRDDEDKDADGTATPVKGKGGKGKSNSSTPTMTPRKRHRSALQEVSDTHSRSNSQTRSRSQSAANSQIHLRSRSVVGLSRSKQ